MKIMPMTHAQANEYVHWHYKKPYTFYNIPPEGIEETYRDIFTNPNTHYFSVIKNDRLYGIYQYSLLSHRFEIGLGICPEETGRGNGRAFVVDCIAFGRKQFDYQGPICLEVADFNKRATHVYREVGFVERGREQRLSFGRPAYFITMELRGNGNIKRRVGGAEKMS